MPKRKSNYLYRTSSRIWWSRSKLTTLNPLRRFLKAEAPIPEEMHRNNATCQRNKHESPPRQIRKDLWTNGELRVYPRWRTKDRFVYGVGLWKDLRSNARTLLKPNVTEHAYLWPADKTIHTPVICSIPALSTWRLNQGQQSNEQLYTFWKGKRKTFCTNVQ
jgi:hypothetical protein